MTDSFVLSLSPNLYTLTITGQPKGVMTSFASMIDSTKGICSVLNATSKDRYLSYLPVAHGMERWVGEVGYHQSLCLTMPYLVLHCQSRWSS
jgi:long-subunit acyl-CoA synthetase (AMP-forming)